VTRKNAKNSKSRNVPLTARVVEVLRRRQPAAGGLVFHRADGQPLYQTWLNQQHARLRTLLKMPADFVLHSFRHTFGTRLGETGADAFTIMKLMGHSTVTVSQRYVHPSPEAMESAVSRMEAYNRASAQRVGTNLGTVSTSLSGENQQII
jgi:integrase